jgi:hypothetical protein
MRAAIMSLKPILTVLLTGATLGTPQDAARRTGANLNPCPFGIISIGEIDGVVVPGLEELLRMSDLVVVGTVLTSMPSFHLDLNTATSVATDSLISVTERLWGTIPANGSTVLLNQMGGKAQPCSVVVQDDPLVQPNEQYVLFLRADDRKQVPNSSGVSRYIAPGIWTKAKVVNGKIQFQERATRRLHQFDGTNLDEFFAIVRERIATFSGYKMLRGQ